MKYESLYHETRICNIAVGNHHGQQFVLNWANTAIELPRWPVWAIEIDGCQRPYRLGAVLGDGLKNHVSLASRATCKSLPLDNVECSFREECRLVLAINSCAAVVKRIRHRHIHVLRSRRAIRSRSGECHQKRADIVRRAYDLVEWRRELVVLLGESDVDVPVIFLSVCRDVYLDKRSTKISFRKSVAGASEFIPAFMV
jgi:hypothetical protein